MNDHQKGPLNFLALPVRLSAVTHKKWQDHVINWDR